MGNPWEPTHAPIIADVSFGRESVTGAALVARGFVGVIGYVSKTPAKNLTAAEIADFRAHGLMVGLTYEDSATWMLGGAPAGHAAGILAAQQAATIGYPADCIIGASADFNVSPGELGTVIACYSAFSQHVRAAGYGARRFLDGIPAGDTRWQTNAGSWSSSQIDPAAALLQFYDDPRAGGLPVDVNEVRTVPVGLMGEPPVPPTVPADDQLGDDAMFGLPHIAIKASAPANALLVFPWGLILAVQDETGTAYQNVKIPTPGGTIVGVPTVPYGDTEFAAMLIVANARS